MWHALTSAHGRVKSEIQKTRATKRKWWPPVLIIFLNLDFPFPIVVDCWNEKKGKRRLGLVLILVGVRELNLWGGSGTDWRKSKDPYSLSPAFILADIVWWTIHSRKFVDFWKWCQSQSSDSTGVYKSGILFTTESRLYFSREKIIRHAFDYRPLCWTHTRSKLVQPWKSHWSKIIRHYPWFKFVCNPRLSVIVTLHESTLIKSNNIVPEKPIELVPTCQ